MTTARRLSPVFLSAGVPYADPTRNPDGAKYTCHAMAVREAIRALVSAVVPDGPLVFGGQPAITPFVWDAARSLKAEEHVYIFQSKLYSRLVPTQARFFKNLVWTPAFPNASPGNSAHRRRCLETMRHQMIVTRSPGQGRKPLPKYRAAVFIGGMDGVEEEWDLFIRNYEHTPVFPISSTGGAAYHLFQAQWPKVVQKIQWKGMTPQPYDLANELRYRRLFRTLMKAIP